MDSEKDREAIAQAAATREVVLEDVEAAQDRCRSLEAELETCGGSVRKKPEAARRRRRR